jgi:CHAD domain-containing protein
VQILFLEEQSEQFPYVACLIEFLNKQERHLKKSSVRDVRRCKTRKLKKWTADFCRALESNPKTTEHHEALSANACHALATAFAEVASRREKMSAAHPRSIHDTRVAFKHLRYMVESLSPAFTGLHQNELRRFGVYQTRLGALQDLEVLLATLNSFSAQHPEAAAHLHSFSKFLYERRARAIDACLTHADDLYRVCAPLGFSPEVHVHAAAGDRS